MATMQKFNNTVDYLARKAIDLSADVFKLMLTNTAPVATNSVYTDVSAGDLATANGYTNGGTTLTTTSLTNTSGVETLKITNTSITASGGSIGPFRYAIIYDNTASAKPLIGYVDYGSSISLASGEPLNINFDATNGLLQIS